MPSIRTLKRRIKTTKNISKITRAMEMVSASKMKRAQDAALAGRPYSNELSKILHRLGGQIREKLHPLLAEGNPIGAVGILLLSTDKGLCGGLNTNLFLTLEKQGKILRSNVNGQLSNVKFITVGRKSRDYAAKMGYQLLASFVELPDRPVTADIQPIANLITGEFVSGTLKEVWIVYPAFVSTLTQESRVVKLLPLGELATSPTSSGDYLFEPDPDTVLNELLPFYIANRLYQLLLETKASEQSARMVAMKNAHDNAQELVGDLSLTYNRARQSRITNELLDAIGSRMALS